MISGVVFVASIYIASHFIDLFKKPEVKNSCMRSIPSSSLGFWESDQDLYYSDESSSEEELDVPFAHTPNCSSVDLSAADADVPSLSEKALVSSVTLATENSEELDADIANCTETVNALSPSSEEDESCQESTVSNSSSSEEETKTVETVETVEIVEVTETEEFDSENFEMVGTEKVTPAPPPSNSWFSWN